MKKKEAVNHPNHYQNEDPRYEVIKIIDAYKLGFSLGNTIKYVLRSGKKKRKPTKKIKNLQDLELVQLKKTVEDLRKSIWYTQHHIDNIIEDYKKKYSIKRKIKI